MGHPQLLDVVALLQSLPPETLHLTDERYNLGSLVIPGIHNSMIFRANKECPYKSSWIL
jgi:hypothetical protein